MKAKVVAKDSIHVMTITGIIFLSESFSDIFLFPSSSGVLFFQASLIIIVARALIHGMRRLNLTL
jgi:hypothetical protein